MSSRLFFFSSATKKLVLDHLLQFACFKQFVGDIAAADEFTLHVYLRESWPFVDRLQCFKKVHIFQNIEITELHAGCFQNFDRTCAESAHRHIRSALHVHKRRFGFYLLLDGGLIISHGVSL